MNKPAGRTGECTKADARERLARAKAFMYVADLIGTAEVEGLKMGSVASTLAVLAGIAAADAASCHALGVRARGQAHPQAVAIVKTIVPRGSDIAKELDRLLTIKDNAHYGMLSVDQQTADRAVRATRRLVQYADEVVAST